MSKKVLSMVNWPYSGQVIKKRAVELALGVVNEHVSVVDLLYKV